MRLLSLVPAAELEAALRHAQRSACFAYDVARVHDGRTRLGRWWTELGWRLDHLAKAYERTQSLLGYEEQP